MLNPWLYAWCSGLVRPRKRRAHKNTLANWHKYGMMIPSVWVLKGRNLYKKEISIMRDKVLEVLEGEFPEIDFLSSDELVDDGILDSLTLTGIIAALTMEFGITIPYEEIIEENFNSVDGMASMVERLMD